jgi:hypothetical protein
MIRKVTEDKASELTKHTSLLLLIPAETNVWDTSFGLTTYKFI